MRTVTKFLFIFLFLQNQSIACKLAKPLVSLSGPVTMVLEELNLLEDPNLAAISVFHPINKKTSAKILAGGVFLSKRTMESFQDKFVFFDKSMELKKNYKMAKIKNFAEINSLGLDSFELTKLIIQKHREVIIP